MEEKIKDLKEKWKDVEGYEDSHQISNIGRVRTKCRYIKNNKGRTYLLKGKLLTLCDDKDGYKRVTLCKNNTTKTVSVHRLVCHHFVENINKDDIVNHKDGIKYNNLYTNLEKCTIRYNCRHYVEVICNKENVGIRQLPSGNWQARKNHLSIGTFKTKEDAQKAYDDSF